MYDSSDFIFRPLQRKNISIAFPQLISIENKKKEIASHAITHQNSNGIISHCQSITLTFIILIPIHYLEKLSIMGLNIHFNRR